MSRGQLVVAEAFLVGTVEIRIAPIAALLGSRDEGVAHRQRLHVGDAERSALAVQLIRATLLVFGLAEIRQHVVVAPADIAELAPAVEILALPANVQQSVDR
jgi:hypothetical protein